MNSITIITRLIIFYSIFLWPLSTENIAAQPIAAQAPFSPVFTPSSMATKQAAPPPLLTVFIERIEEPPSPISSTVLTTQPKPTIAALRKQIRSRALPGIYASYGGACTYSDENGQLVFSYKRPTPYITLIITRNIQPVSVQGTVVNHFRIVDNEPTIHYQLFFNQHKQTKQAEWTITKAPLPKDTIIPADALIIFAHPDDIQVPTGTVKAIKSPNIILPTLFANSNPTHLATSSLSFLAINRFCALVKRLYRTAQTRYGMVVAP